MTTAAATPQRRSPAGPKAEQRVRDILRVGREVFAERGYEGATTTEIAQRLGISEATIFTYFRGKRELCQRAIQDWYDENIAAMQAGLPREASVRAQLEYLVLTNLRVFLVQGTGICALVLSEGRAKGPGLGEGLVELQRRYTAPLMALLARGQEAGEVRRDIPLRLLRSLVFGPIEQMLWEVVITGRQIDVEASARDLVALLWPALQAPDQELQQLRRLRGQLQALLAQS
ncbi:MAG: TetR/AcrR family transcriptional regulator [Comamonadaceae bacterium]|jgi:AcrR family transcriptional regulator|nr:TetR/AcrR family transcriptional regulator [Comamonadaceae bacterium]